MAKSRLVLEKLVKEARKLLPPEVEITEEDLKIEYARLLNEVDSLLRELEQKAANEDNLARAVAAEDLRRRLFLGCYKLRKRPGYIAFMEECLKARTPPGASLKDTQEAMMECAGIWRSLDERAKKEWERKAGYAIYDYC